MSAWKQIPRTLTLPELIDVLNRRKPVVAEVETSDLDAATLADLTAGGGIPVITL